MGRKLAQYDSAIQARKAFLRQLRRCGDVREACREAGVSKTWAYSQRRRRPRFAMRWTRALDTWKRNEPERTRRRLCEQDPTNPLWWPDHVLRQVFAQYQRRRSRRQVSKVSSDGQRATHKATTPYIEGRRQQHEQRD